MPFINGQWIEDFNADNSSPITDPAYLQEQNPLLQQIQQTPVQQGPDTWNQMTADDLNAPQIPVYEQRYQDSKAANPEPNMWEKLGFAFSSTGAGFNGQRAPTNPWDAYNVRNDAIENRYSQEGRYQNAYDDKMTQQSVTNDLRQRQFKQTQKYQNEMIKAAQYRALMGGAGTSTQQDTNEYWRLVEKYGEDSPQVKKFEQYKLKPRDYDSQTAYDTSKRNNEATAKAIPKYRGLRDQADNSLKSLGEARDLLSSGLQTGSMSKYLPDLWKSPKMQRLISIINTEVLQMSQQMSGTLTQTDMDFLQRTTINENFSPETNKRILETKIKLLQRVRDESHRRIKHYQDGGNDADFKSYNEMSEYKPNDYTAIYNETTNADGYSPEVQKMIDDASK